MPRSSNNKRPRRKLLLGLGPKILLLSFLSFASTEDSSVKNSAGSIKKRCAYVDDGFALKDCGNAPTQSEFADFLKKQAEEVARLAREFPCGYTSCPNFKRDLEFIYHTIEKRKNEDHAEHVSGDMGNGIFNDQHITKGMLEETQSQTNYQSWRGQDGSMKGVDSSHPIKPSESLLLMAGPKNSQIPISPEVPMYKAPEKFQKPNSNLNEEKSKLSKPKVDISEETAEDWEEIAKNQNADYLWRSERSDSKLSKSDSNSHPRIYNLPEPISSRFYDRVPDDFQQTSSTSTENSVQDIEPRFDVYGGMSYTPEERETSSDES